MKEGAGGVRFQALLAYRSPRNPVSEPASASGARISGSSEASHHHSQPIRSSNPSSKGKLVSERESLREESQNPSSSSL